MSKNKRKDKRERRVPRPPLREADYTRAIGYLELVSNAMLAEGLDPPSVATAFIFAGAAFAEDNDCRHIIEIARRTKCWPPALARPKN